MWETLTISNRAISTEKEMKGQLDWISGENEWIERTESPKNKKIKGRRKKSARNTG